MSTMSTSAKTPQVKLLTFNVWSCEHVAVYRRIQSICDIIRQHDPDIIFLQEVTRYINTIFQKAAWWSRYKTFSGDDGADKHFCLLLCKEEHQVFPGIPKPWIPETHEMPRGLITASVQLRQVEARGGYCPMQVSTCRLGSPTPSDVGSMERHEGISLIFDTLEKSWYQNSVLGGDMNWDEDLDGPLPIEDRPAWVDAWCALRGRGDGDAGCGWTYDAEANPMLSGRKPERKRPDRFLCKLDNIQMVGVEPIPGVTYYDDDREELPVLPSHRFSLLLTMSLKKN